MPSHPASSVVPATARSRCSNATRSGSCRTLKSGGGSDSGGGARTAAPSRFDSRRCRSDSRVRIERATVCLAACVRGPALAGRLCRADLPFEATAAAPRRMVTTLRRRPAAADAGLRRTADRMSLAASIACGVGGVSGAVRVGKGGEPCSSNRGRGLRDTEDP